MRCEADLSTLQSYPIPTAEGIELSINGRPTVFPEGYFKQFLFPRIGKHGDPTCIGCGSLLTHMLLGTFTWGLVWGEGFCGACGYPIRYYHTITADRTQHIAIPLQYHPDLLSERKGAITNNTPSERV
jgi:hypothetical protein